MQVTATFVTRHNTQRGEYHIPVLIFNRRTFELSRSGYASRTGAQLEADAALSRIEKAVLRLVQAKSPVELRTAKARASKIGRPLPSQKGPLHPSLADL
jgi:hypothetical protein